MSPILFALRATTLHVLLLPIAMAMQIHLPREIGSGCDLAARIPPWSKTVAEIEEEFGPCLEATFDKLCVGLLPGSAARYEVEYTPPKRSVLLTDVFKVLADYSRMSPERDNCNSEGQVQLWLGFASNGDVGDEAMARMIGEAAHKTAPFIGVAGGDDPFPRRGGKTEQLLRSGGWRGQLFSVSPALLHPQLKAYPFGLTFANLRDNDAKLAFEGAETPPSSRTKLLNCHGLGHLGMCGRQRKLDQLEASGHRCAAVGGRLTWPEYIRTMTKAKFAISPAGGCLLNHRDIEAAMSGAVPIFDATATRHPVFAPLKEGLPAVYAGNWSELTPAFLEAQWAQMYSDSRGGKYDMRRAFLPFWLHEVLREAHRLASERQPPPAQVPEELEWKASAC